MGLKAIFPGGRSFYTGRQRSLGVSHVACEFAGAG